jgi:2-oxoglutarate ferredoxin oxidoreductase subunit gamma
VKHEILVIGRGGQGILLLGRILGRAAAEHAGLNVSTTEFYGSETRGTESRVEMVLSDKEGEIDYIRVRRATILLVMYPLNLEKYYELLTPETTVFLNSTYISELKGVSYGRLYKAPYTEIAEKETGTTRTANMVALGHLVAKTGIVKPEHVEDTIRESVPEKWVDPNIKAFRKGLSLD